MTQSQSEQAILNHMRQSLIARQTELSLLGIRAELIEPLHAEVSDSIRSEAVVYFWKGGQLLDVLEFAITESGEPTASVDQTTGWFDGALEDVIHRIQSASSRS